MYDFLGYRSSIETTALNCLALKKSRFFCILTTDRQTDRHTDEHVDSTDASSRSRCRERRLNNAATALAISRVSNGLI